MIKKRGEIRGKKNEEINRDKEISFSKSILKKNTKKTELPISIFKYKLSKLRTIVKYLKEDLNAENQEMADLLNRNYKTICSTYSKAKEVMPKRFNITESQIFIPISIFTNRKFSVLENLVTYLKEVHSLRYKEIANLLNLHYKTISTVANRAVKKREK